MKRFAIILAAGKGTRMKSKVNKMLHPVMGQPMVNYSVEVATQAGAEEIISILGVDAEMVQDYLGDRSQFAYQEEQLGTAHAVMQAADLLEGKEGTTLVICGDTPLISNETIENLYNYHEQEGAKATILTAIADDPFSYGRVLRSEEGTVTKIVEQKDATEEEKQVREINTGTYCFDNKALFEALKQVDNNNAQGEYYLPDVIEILNAQDEKVSAYSMTDMVDSLGVNDRTALAKANQLMQQRINQQHMLAGVTLIDPDNTYIEAGVEIGPDTTIEPGVYLKGQTTIGSNVTIGMGSVITDSQIADDVTIISSNITEATVGQHSDIGPNSRLRKGAILEDNVHIGNYVEVKNATLKSGVKAGHHAYIGDATIGERVNVSCGVIFANYDGMNKHHSVIEADVFIGSNVTIVSPVIVQAGAFLAAGSTINQDVAADALAIARSRQENKADYVKNLPASKK